MNENYDINMLKNHKFFMDKSNKSDSFELNIYNNDSDDDTTDRRATNVRQNSSYNNITINSSPYDDDEEFVEEEEYNPSTSLPLDLSYTKFEYNPLELDDLTLIFNDDNNILNNACEELDKEKIEITRYPLPIVDKKSEELEKLSKKIDENTIKSFKLSRNDIINHENIIRNNIFLKENNKILNLIKEKKLLSKLYNKKKKLIEIEYELLKKKVFFTIKNQENVINNLFGYYSPFSFSYLTHLYYSLQRKYLPQPMEFHFHFLRAVKNKLPKGKYRIMVSIYDKIGGKPIQLFDQPSSSDENYGLGSSGIGWLRPGITKLVSHYGKISEKIVRFEDSAYCLCPNKLDLFTSNIFLIELIQCNTNYNDLTSQNILLNNSINSNNGNIATSAKPTNPNSSYIKNQKHTSNLLNTEYIDEFYSKDRVVAWSVLPMFNDNYDILRGKFKLPMIRGEHSPIVSHFNDIEFLMKSNLNNWLCNLYFELKPVHFNELGLNDDVVNSPYFDINFLNDYNSIFYKNKLNFEEVESSDDDEEDDDDIENNNKSSKKITYGIRRRLNDDKKLKNNDLFNDDDEYFFNNNSIDNSNNKNLTFYQKFKNFFSYNKNNNNNKNKKKNTAFNSIVEKLYGESFLDYKYRLISSLTNTESELAKNLSNESKKFSNNLNDDEVEMKFSSSAYLGYNKDLKLLNNKNQKINLDALLPDDSDDNSFIDDDNSFIDEDTKKNKKSTLQQTNLWNELRDPKELTNYSYSLANTNKKYNYNTTNSFFSNIKNNDNNSSISNSLNLKKFFLTLKIYFNHINLNFNFINQILNLFNKNNTINLFNKKLKNLIFNLFLFLFIYLFILYLHYILQYIFLLIFDIKIYTFKFYNFYIIIKYNVKSFNFLTEFFFIAFSYIFLILVHIFLYYLLYFTIDIFNERHSFLLLYYNNFIPPSISTISPLKSLKNIPSNYNESQFISKDSIIQITDSSTSNNSIQNDKIPPINLNAIVPPTNYNSASISPLSSPIKPLEKIKDKKSVQKNPEKNDRNFDKKHNNIMMNGINFLFVIYLNFLDIFINYFGFLLILHPLFLLIIDLIFHNYSCKTYDDYCYDDYTSYNCNCFYGDSFKLYNRLESTTTRVELPINTDTSSLINSNLRGHISGENNYVVDASTTNLSAYQENKISSVFGILTILLFYFIYVIINMVINYYYVLILHNKRSNSDRWFRLYANTDELFIPYDNEISKSELFHILKKSREWNELGTKRKFFIYDVLSNDKTILLKSNNLYINDNFFYCYDEKYNEINNDERYKNIDSNNPTQIFYSIVYKKIVIYHISSDNKEKVIYRQFILLPSERVLEVFSSLKKDKNGQKTREAILEKKKQFYKDTLSEFKKSLASSTSSK